MRDTSPVEGRIISTDSTGRRTKSKLAGLHVDGHGFSRADDAGEFLDPVAFDAGIRALRGTADGVFCYTFFKGVGRKAH